MTPTHEPEIKSVESPPHAQIILVTLILGAFVANINLSIANVALPDIGKALNATTVEQTMVASTFTMGLASSVLYLGALGDRYGRRKLLLFGALLTIPAGIASAYAPNIEFLIGARYVAGLAAGLMFPTTLSLISALWRGSAQTRAIALWSGIGGGAAALGGVIGGAMLNSYWWGSVFLFALPLALVVFILAVKYVPAHAGEEKGAVDHLGGALSVIGVATLILGIQFLPNGFSLVMAGLFAVAVVALVLFYFRQKVAPRPLVDLKRASSPTFWVSALAGTIAFGSLMGALFLGQQFTQNVLQYDTLKAALVTLPLSVMLIVMSPISGKLVSARGSKQTLFLGLVVVAVGFFAMIVLWDDKATIYGVLLAYGIVGAGVGIAATPAAHSLMASLPTSRAGMGSAFTDLTRDFGGAVMQAVMGTILAIVYADYFTNAFDNLTASEAKEVSKEAAQEIIGSFQGAEDVAGNFPQVQAEKLMNAASQAFTEGKSAAYLLALVLTVVAVVFVLWKYPRKQQEFEFFHEIALESEAEARAVGELTATGPSAPGSAGGIDEQPSPGGGG